MEPTIAKSLEHACSVPAWLPPEFVCVSYRWMTTFRPQSPPALFTIAAHACMRVPRPGVNSPV